jgi:hypothetical protein
MGSQQIGFKNLSFLFAIREDHAFIKDYTGFILNIKRYVYLFYGLLKITGFDDIDGKGLSVACSSDQKGGVSTSSWPIVIKGLL